MVEITIQDLRNAQRKGSKEAITINKALGLSYLTVRREQLIKINADGSEEKLGKKKKKKKKIQKGRYKIK